MNTIAFGEEIVAEDVAADEVVTEEVVNDDVAEVTEDVAAVEEAGEATLDDAELEDASLAAVGYEEDGIGYDKKGAGKKAVTAITFESNGEKKNPVNNVATITNTTDPVSWNNFYAAKLIQTVLDGSDKKDEYLNNSEKITVSQNNDGDGVPNLLDNVDPNAVYGSIEVEDNVYVLFRYSVGDWNAAGTAFVTNSDYVNGVTAYADNNWAPLHTITATGTNARTDLIARADVQKVVDRVAKLPVTTWDGRKIAWNKSGDHDENKGAKNVLDVKAALVTYDNGTVKELNGAEISNVKIDAKAMKAASVEYATTQTKVSGKYIDDGVAPAKEMTANFYVPQHNAINTVPSFTVTMKTKGKDVKKYAKNLKSALSNYKFTFGIMQAGIEVTDPTNIAQAGYVSAFNTVYLTPGTALAPNYHINDAKVDDDVNTIGTWVGVTGKASNVKEVATANTASGNDITNDQDTGVQDLLTQDSKTLGFMRGGYVEGVDISDSTTIGNGLNTLTISKFNGNKGTATIAKTVPLFSKKTSKGTATINLKAKKEYSFNKTSLAGEDVYTLEFADGGNYIYAETNPSATATDLSAFGFKWAFRKSPVDKSKDFRRGIAADTNLGFVFNAE